MKQKKLPGNKTHFIARQKLPGNKMRFIARELFLLPGSFFY